MKYYQRINLEPFHIQEAISMLLGARLYLGQTLYFGFNTYNKGLRKRKTSLAEFMRVVNKNSSLCGQRDYFVPKQLNRRETH